MPLQYVEINMIKADRELWRGDDLESLQKSIEEIGVIHPPLLTGDLTVIDGLRRISVLRKWKHEGQILCLVTDDYLEAIKYLQEETEREGVVDPIRLAEIYNTLRPMGNRYGRAMRTLIQTGKTRGQRVKGANTGIGFGIVYAKAMKVPWYLVSNSTEFLRVGQRKLTARQRAEYMDMYDVVKMRQMTPSGARNKLNRTWSYQPKSVDAEPSVGMLPLKRATPTERDLAAIRTAVGTVEGVMLGVREIVQLGDLKESLGDEAAKLVKRLEKARRELSRFIKILDGQGSSTSGKAAQ